MASILLDTTVLIDLLRGRPGAVSKLRALRSAGDRPHVCAINVEEVVRGIRGQVETEAVMRLFDGLEMVALARQEGQRAGEWRRAFGARGVTLSQAYCLIAAAAVSIGGRLATANPSDLPMTEFALDHWPAGG